MGKTPKAITSRGFNRQVSRVHFEEFSSQNFERLVFAYALRDGRADAEWLGQAGGDGGRDVWCNGRNRPSAVFLCANYKRLTFAKASSDLQKLSKGGHKPAEVYVVAGGIVSATLRTRIKAEAIRLGFSAVTVWAGPEFEERVRISAPDLLKRFCDGEEFPDSPDELRTSVVRRRANSGAKADEKTSAADSALSELSPEATSL